MLDFFVRSEAVSTPGAFAAAANGGAFARSARINNFVILTAAFRATHRNPQLIVLLNFYHAKYGGVKES